VQERKKKNEPEKNLEGTDSSCKRKSDANWETQSEKEKSWAIRLAGGVKNRKTSISFREGRNDQGKVFGNQAFTLVGTNSARKGGKGWEPGVSEGSVEIL